jgi:hypothetical protein
MLAGVRARHFAIVGFLLSSGCPAKPEGQTSPPPATSTPPAPAVDYQFATNETTSYGPAQADVVTSKTNWITCSGQFALCAYSGPDTGSPALPCTVTADGQFANCECPVMTGDYEVDVNAILDVAVFDATTTTSTPTDSACCIKDPNANWDCSGCKPDMAAVCTAIDDQTLFPGSSYASVSTFSTALSEQGTVYSMAPTQCTQSMYAGCMTAPCMDSGKQVVIEDKPYPLHTCTCPTWTGLFQVSTTITKSDCALDAGQPGGNIWSAAYIPALAEPLETTP